MFCTIEILPFLIWTMAATTNTEGEWCYVSRNYLPCESRIRRDHVLGVFGEQAIGKSVKELESWASAMEGERTDARSWASMAVAKIMIEEAQRAVIRFGKVVAR